MSVMVLNQPPCTSSILLVLLFPPDHSHAQIKRSLRKSGGTQWSNKVPSPADGVTKSTKTKRTLSPIHQIHGQPSHTHRKKVRI